MNARTIIAVSFFLLLSHEALSELARHTSAELGRSGTPESYTVMLADENGNLRIESYGATGRASSSPAGDIETSFSQGDLRDLMIFQAKEGRMLMFDRGRCEVMSLEDGSLPGMGPGSMDDMQQQMAEAQREMQAALEEMRKEDPEMAKMLEQQMGGPAGMGAMMQQPREMIVEETGDDRTIGDYDTTRFVVREAGSNLAPTTVWAADIDDVEGGRLVGRAMKGMFETFKEVMDRMGVGAMAGTGSASAIIEKMEDYYPILTEDQDGQTKLIKAG